MVRLLATCFAADTERGRELQAIQSTAKEVQSDVIIENPTNAVDRLLKKKPSQELAPSAVAYRSDTATHHGIFHSARP